MGMQTGHTLAEASYTACGIKREMTTSHADHTSDGRAQLDDTVFSLEAPPQEPTLLADEVGLLLEIGVRAPVR